MITSLDEEGRFKIPTGDDGNEYRCRIWHASLSNADATKLLANPGQVDVFHLWEKPGILKDEEAHRRLPGKSPISKL